MADIEQRQITTEVTSFPLGVDSYTDPLILPNGQVRWAINATNRGGVWKCRPGMDEVLSFPQEQYLGLRPQMGMLFTPTGDVPYLVVGLAGKIYISRSNGNGGFDAPQQLTNLQFNPLAPQLMWAVGTKSVEILENGDVQNIPARKMLVIQDGASSRAGFWDGTTNRHTNPDPGQVIDSNGAVTFRPGYNEIPLGGWMAWSGNRLWVSRGIYIFASDENDPLSFTEMTSRSLVPAFTMGEEVTSMVDRGVTGNNESLVLAFGYSTVTCLRSGVLDRSQWNSTPDFVRIIFKGTGCIAGKSVTNHQGLLYWYSEPGVVMFDSTNTVNSTQRLPPQDMSLNYSKAQIASNKHLIAGGFAENYVMMAVPSASHLNRHIQVLDTAAARVDFTKGQMSWQGVWTGINPVEFSTVQINGATRTFATSLDDDGIPRVWELFKGARGDNLQAVPWTIETPPYTLGGMWDKFNFQYARMYLVEVYRNVRVQVKWKGLRGNYHEIMDKMLTATPGAIFMEAKAPAKFNTPAYSNRPQTRDISTPNRSDSPDQCTSSKVESPDVDMTDHAFSLLFKFTGNAGLKAFRISTQVVTQPLTGDAPPSENGLHELPEPAGRCPSYTKGDVITDVNEYPQLPRGDQEAFSAFQPSLPDDPYTAPPLTP